MKLGGSSKGMFYVRLVSFGPSGSEVQELIEDNSTEDSLRKGFEKMKIEIKPVSSSEVNPVRPSTRTSSAATIRRMRD